jgi:hypothetical protein
MDAINPLAGKIGKNEKILFRREPFGLKTAHLVWGSGGVQNSFLAQPAQRRHAIDVGQTDRRYGLLLRRSDRQCSPMAIVADAISRHGARAKPCASPALRKAPRIGWSASSRQ